MEIAIETRGLSKTYRGGVRAVKPMDLTVPTGCCFGLLGPNGAGKSTLVKTLLSIVRPTGGEATMLGRDIRTKESRRGVGYLPEGHRFPTYLTGRGVLQYYGKLSGYGGPDLNAAIDKNLDIVGMSAWADQRTTKYSKGMKQRVGLANAMLGSPKLIFLDEPTDGVDPQGRREIREVIKEIAAQGVTVFLNSHLLSEVERTSDRIAIMQKGALITQGTVEEVKAQVSSGGQQTVSFRTAAIPSALWTSLESRGATRPEDDGRFQIAIDDDGDTSKLIDELRAAKVDIYAVEPVQLDLEDAFLQIIHGDEGVGGEQ